MFISPINLSQINFKPHKQPPFKGTSPKTPLLGPEADEFKKSKPVLKRGQILNNCGTIYVDDHTRFFRSDLDWKELGDYLQERFKDFDKINTYDYACSDGSEAYSLSMLLQHKFKDRAEKFFPIYAKDLDKNKIQRNIQDQKTGAVNHKLKIKNAAKEINADEKEIKENFAISEYDNICRAEIFNALKEKVTKSVEFSEANILNDVKNIDPKNPSIVFCRNMWAYVDSKEYPEFAENLYKNLAQGSIVVLGSFDVFSDIRAAEDSKKISKALINAGFEKSKCRICTKYNSKYETTQYGILFEKNTESDIDSSGKIAKQSNNFNPDTIAAECEEIILNSIKKQNDMHTKSAIKSSRDVELINEAFKRDSIGRIYPCGISLNGAINYLAQKGQIQLNDGSILEKSAFVIDDLSRQFIERIKREDPCKYKRFVENVNSGNIVLYCLAEDDTEAQKLINNFGVKDIDLSAVRIIKNSEDELTSLYPDKEKIKKIIKAFVQYKFPGQTSNRKKLTAALAKYLKDSFLFMSYGELSKAAKSQYDLIEKEVLSCGKTMDDVIYIIPAENKSYGIINYIYAMENGIPQDKFMSLTDIEEKIEEGNNKVYVALDDISIGGSSAKDILFYFRKHIFKNQKGRDLIIAPMVYTPDAENFFANNVDNLQNEEKNINAVFLKNKKYDTIGGIKSLKAFEKRFKLDLRDDIEEYLKNFECLNEDEIDFLTSTLSGGCGNQYGGIFFPYMIPDNSSDFMAILASYFLNRDTNTSNKAVECFSNFAGERIKREDYKKIKKFVGE